MENTRTHVVLPTSLVKDIDKYVGERKRSSFLTSLASREIQRLKQVEAFKNVFGIWKDRKDIKDGVSYQRKLRAEGEKRFKKQF